MNQATWSAVDDYFAAALLSPDAALESVLQANSAAGLPPYDVTPAQGKLLHMLVRLLGARRILEIGTLGGYSTVWLARALPPDGRLITLEIDPKHAEIAAANFVRAGVSSAIEVHVGDALNSLTSLAAEDRDPFDFIFIDADKKRNAEYFTWALQLARAGTLIVVDNVVRGGAILDQHGDNPDIVGVRKLVQMAAQEPRITATALQTVGRKGYDGFIIAVVK